MNADERRVEGAHTPEELETLLEDALLLRDRSSLAALFETAAILIAGEDHPVRGRDDIARTALAAWDGDHVYLADPRRVLVAGDIALVVAERGINVMHRGGDRFWRYAIILQRLEESNERETTWFRR